MVRFFDRICRVDYDNIVAIVCITFSLLKLTSIDLTSINRFFFIISLSSFTFRSSLKDSHISLKL